MSFLTFIALIIIYSFLLNEKYISVLRKYLRKLKINEKLLKRTLKWYNFRRKGKKLRSSQRLKTRRNPL